MQIEIKIDSLYDEPKVVVLTASMTEEVHSLVEKLSEKNHLLFPASETE